MMEQTNPARAEEGDLEFVMPCADALMAGTLALMTGHARCGCAQHRDMMARKAAVNLHTLSGHPQISDGLRTVTKKLYEQWIEIIQTDLAKTMSAAVRTPNSTPDHDTLTREQIDKAIHHRANWHTTPETIQ
jgi:hypothetical protein